MCAEKLPKNSEKLRKTLKKLRKADENQVHRGTVYNYIYIHYIFF